MQCTIFYSWQSDLKNSTNRGFIEDALERAIKVIRGDDSVLVQPVTDRDTKDVPGAPSIAETIFSKIEVADVFVCDVSFVNFNAAEGDDQIYRLTPNPNVLIELGYAVRQLGWSRVLMVMNTAFAPSKPIESLPFDLRHKRVLTYHLPDGVAKAEQRAKLQGMFDGHLRAILANVEQERRNVHLAQATVRVQTEKGPSTQVTVELRRIEERPSIAERVGSESKEFHGTLFPKLLSQKSYALEILRPSENDIINYLQKSFPRFLEEQDRYLETKNRIASLVLVVENNGSTSATNVQIIADFSSLGSLLSEHDLPQRPHPPERPKSHMQSTILGNRMYDYTLPLGITPLARFQPRNEKEPHVIGRGSAEWLLERLQHGRSIVLDPLYFLVRLPDESPIKVELPFQIHAPEFKTAITGKIVCDVTITSIKWSQALKEDAEESREELEAKKVRYDSP